MQFNFQQKREIYENGYTIIRGAVPQVMVNEARRAINASVGQGMNVDEMTKFRAQSYCPEVRTTPVITDLFNKTPVFSMAESVLGEGNFDEAGAGQIALRFPVMKDPPPKVGYHLDGFPTPTNGVPAGTIGNFTALVGMYLSDVLEENSGNFTVWPGSHRATEKYFQEHGPDSFLEGFPKIELPQPVQITGKAGDVIFCHYQVAHGIAPNVSPNVRYGIFFRVKHHAHNSHPKDTLANIWMDWPGMQEEHKQG
jgi:hypothetical protein